jgi:hypothetical protein
MHLNTEHRKLLVDEFRYAAKKIRESEYPELKLFYFSVTYGVLSRIFNLQYNPQLVFMHLVLNNAYGNISARVQAIKTGDIVVQLSNEYFSLLAGYVEVLSNQIEADEDTYKTLEKIALLTFLTTGNGYYLFQKGVIKFE